VVGRDRRARRWWLVCGDSFRDNPIVAHELKSALIDFVRFAETKRARRKLFSIISSARSATMV